MILVQSRKLTEKSEKSFDTKTQRKTGEKKMCIFELFESSGQKKERRTVSLTKMDFLKGFWTVLN